MLLFWNAVRTQLLDDVDLFNRYSGRRNRANRLAAVLSLDFSESARGFLNCALPRYLLPRLVDAVPDHGPVNTFLVVRISPRKPTFDAGSPVIGFPFFIRHHCERLDRLSFPL